MEGTATQRLVIVDGNNIFLRNLYSPYAADAPHKVHENAINLLGLFVRKFKPSHCIVIFDHGRSRYRLSKYPEYKAHRSELNEDGTKHIETFQSILNEMGIHVFWEDGVEGDDVIANVVTTLGVEFNDVVVVSADKDLRQLARRNTRIYHYDKDVILTSDDIERIEHCPPSRLPELWALCGDKTDNIPGVPGVGPKTAHKLLDTHYTFLMLLLSDEPKLNGQRSIIRLSLDLVRTHPEESSFDWVTPMLEFEPFQPGSDQASRVRRALDDAGLQKIRLLWEGNALWSSPGRRPRRVSAPFV